MSSGCIALAVNPSSLWDKIRGVGIYKVFFRFCQLAAVSLRGVGLLHFLYALFPPLRIVYPKISLFYKSGESSHLSVFERRIRESVHLRADEQIRQRKKHLTFDIIFIIMALSTQRYVMWNILHSNLWRLYKNGWSSPRCTICGKRIKERILG